MLFAILIYWITGHIARSRGIDDRRYAYRAAVLYIVLALGGGFLFALIAPEAAEDGLLPGFIIDVMAGFFSVAIVGGTLPTVVAASANSDQQTPSPTLDV